MTASADHTQRYLRTRLQRPTRLFVSPSEFAAASRTTPAPVLEAFRADQDIVDQGQNAPLTDEQQSV
ncbi:hypothetical protein [Saccharopolyspora endophytica]|uniref:Uncharacterized protein n=1 Tax=Saccharopolyspora endophytica TaxID=543886 RepID=A0ABS5DAV5_9PSEU|nr:hypothetical protein [Saccharopolyspora endophytica]MBQ0923411.1 hypothetical protein [Saccharopolyspora endophytica]